MDYDQIGVGYKERRVADPRVARQLHATLGDAATLVNVGAGAGSYESRDLCVTAVEPSSTMIGQRKGPGSRVVQATAEALPFKDSSFDAAMAILTMHHWPNWRLGIREMVRVARRGVVLTWDPIAGGFWLTEHYFPQIREYDHAIFPSMRELAGELNGATIVGLEIPGDCSDGFLGAYWRRPHAYLDSRVRSAISSFNRPESFERGLNELSADLESGLWEQRHGHLRERESLDVGYRLVTWDSGV